MDKYAFKMQLRPGMEHAYKKAHDEIWPELVDLLIEAGVSDYSIHFDPETHTLFAVLWRSDDQALERLPESAVMRRWWAAMSEFLEMTDTGEPVAKPLRTVFHMRGSGGEA